MMRILEANNIQLKICLLDFFLMFVCFSAVQTIVVYIFSDLPDDSPWHFLFFLGGMFGYIIAPLIFGQKRTLAMQVMQVQLVTKEGKELSKTLYFVRSFVYPIILAMAMLVLMVNIIFKTKFPYDVFFQVQMVRAYG